MGRHLGRTEPVATREVCSARVARDVGPCPHSVLGERSTRRNLDRLEPGIVRIQRQSPGRSSQSSGRPVYHFGLLSFGRWAWKYLGWYWEWTNPLPARRRMDDLR